MFLKEFYDLLIKNYCKLVCCILTVLFMRRLYFLLSIFLALQVVAQNPKQILVSGIILTVDSIPVPDVSIINVWTGKTVRSNTSGFFQTEITENDSLLVYHIAFQKQFITENENGRYILLEPEIQELMQVDIIDSKELERKKWRSY